MAEIGEQLLQPEDGWERYLHSNSMFNYDGTWDFEGTMTYTRSNGSIRFKSPSNGDIVILGQNWSSHRSSNIEVYVNEIQVGTFSQSYGNNEEYSVSYIIEGIKKYDLIEIKPTGLSSSVAYTFSGIDVKADNNKFLLKQNNQCYTFNNSEITLSPSQELTEDNFTVNGFDNPSNITEEQWNNAFPDKADVKLLVWTDDMDKTEIKAECEIEPSTPYDKLENEFEICMATDKETI